MLAITSSSVRLAADSDLAGPFVARLTTNREYPHVLRAQEFFLDKHGHTPLPLGFKGYMTTAASTSGAFVPKNCYTIGGELAYLDDGDVIRMGQNGQGFRALYRKNSLHNTFLVTERCNNWCLMCSQPPKTADDSYLIKEILQVIPLMSPDTPMIGITGGETTLVGTSLVEIIRKLKSYLPRTGVHVLSNGRQFKDKEYVSAIAAVRHPDLMFGIPLYSDLAEEHDYVVQAKGAFDETIRGILNLKARGIKVELRVVLHKQTTARLPQLARFIVRNLTFVDQVALMGLEMMGFTKHNLSILWQDPLDYQPQLVECVEILSRSRVKPLIFNHQLCVLDLRLHRFYCKSISDWKNEFMPECESCTKRQDCGGFFASAKLRYSRGIKSYK